LPATAGGFWPLNCANFLLVSAISPIIHSRKALAAHDPVVPVVLHVEVEWSHQPPLDDRVSGENLIGQGEALARLCRLDGEVVLKQGSPPILDAQHACCLEPICPPLLARFMQQVEFREVGWLEVGPILQKLGCADREDHRVSEFLGLDVLPLARAITKADVGLARPEVRKLAGGVDGEFDVGVQFIEAPEAWHQPTRCNGGLDGDLQLPDITHGGSLAGGICQLIKKRGEAKGKTTACFRQFHATSGAGEQRRSQPILQVPHMAADGCVRHEKLGSRVRKADEPGGSLKGLESIQ
jgi:hypothetical protein